MPSRHQIPANANVYRPTYTLPPPPPTSYPSFPLNYDSSSNPNTIPLGPRPRRRSSPPSFTTHSHHHYHLDPDLDPSNDPSSEPLPRLWDSQLDALMGRTSRAFDLVLHYERDSEGGARWHSDAIARIREIGGHFYDDERALKGWQRIVKYQGDEDQDMMRRIYHDVEDMREYCVRILGAIREGESMLWYGDGEGGVFLAAQYAEFQGQYAGYEDEQYAGYENEQGGNIGMAMETATNMQHAGYDREQGQESRGSGSECADGPAPVPLGRKPLVRGGIGGVGTLILIGLVEIERAMWVDWVMTSSATRGFVW